MAIGGRASPCTLSLHAAYTRRVLFGIPFVGSVLRAPKQGVIKRTPELAWLDVNGGGPTRRTEGPLTAVNGPSVRCISFEPINRAGLCARRD